MLVATLLDTTVGVHYRFLDLCAADGPEGAASDTARGQANGLCGAALPGRLHMITGRHTGPVGVRIELHSAEPPLGDEWEEAVEASFATTSRDLMLASFGHQEGPIDLPPGAYRVRYCADGMDRGNQLTAPGAADEEPVDRYLLQFWPGTGAERIVRQTTETADYWHRAAAKPALTGDELTARVDELRAGRTAGRERDGGPGDDRIRAAGRSGAALRQLDGELLLALADADDEQRRTVACWVAEEELRDAGLADLPWSKAVLAALREGGPLPDRGAILPHLTAAPDGARPQEVVDMLYQAEADPDTLAVAAEMVAAAGWTDPDRLAQLRKAFPFL
jgi:hypothetical protein